ncbi:SDR family oxidoreductase [Bradyrhizobium sp. LHD-71]|uniref:SDR family oxidoreductase n=1 Tax=Bradyrhizobium sp. LHD-71 TaxID=3072141 RepID=UPI00280D5685|nr:SDR family oxidoreductase [Bradyrhizobium sp. LHD-71]MDQ8732300.1 SDR family oxidoreductase [Bradyrhizobium sp. LHD-71]
MRVQDRIVVVTGGAKGIGKALCERFHKEGARKVIVADIDEAGAKAVAASIGGEAYRCDVTKEADIIQLVTDLESRIGPIDLFCSNAGVATAFNPKTENAAGDSNEVWTFGWQVHVMAHVYAARVLIPRMKARGGGYFLHTISAAGLLSQVGSAVYSTTKHAAVGFAENLAITHRADNIRVSMLCPQGVDTPLLRGLPTGPQSKDGVLSAEAVADATIDGLEHEAFVILPHKEVSAYVQNKTSNYDRWIGGMAKLHNAAREQSLASLRAKRSNPV